MGRGLAPECRRRVKEQQKRIGAAEFRNTHFSYVLGLDGVEKFLSTPELLSESSIGADPLELGQVWVISPGSQDEAAGLYRIEATDGQVCDRRWPRPMRCLHPARAPTASASTASRWPPAPRSLHPRRSNPTPQPYP